ncbi:Helix-hairpin-helix motif-containing protein [Methylobacterium sp. UNC378MF]|uniref:helix-hairpin-helix domain-containing protein n=1 Tax=Methylobacterium sp. UNC378MF TaxID=1502748 RepID=UPI00087F735E|nr:helix-hairpin-helix domain-containing protein [Methylobacterium sp. UNC378MF]SDA10704.1 Helix-hairpin-helix motif-containing protein [Methylobacterium sp. UNC378MF]
MHIVLILVEWCVLSGPAILRVSVLLIIAGLLAAVVQVLLPSPVPGPASPPASAPSAPAAPEAAPPVARPEPAPAPSVEPAPPPAGKSPAPAGPTQMPSDAMAFPADPPAPLEAHDQAQGQEGAGQAAGQAEVERAEDSAGPRALAVLDLNTASVADLNRLRGGGSIGRAIVAKRPYTSVEQLLSKRVLSRPVYEKIKDQVTVR